MASAAAAAPARLALATLLFVSLAAALAAGRADGAQQSWSAYLAPAAACRGASDSSAGPVAQGRAIRCLVNWARAQDRRGLLAPSRPLERAAVLKGLDVASCNELSHTPCSSDFTSSVRTAGYRYSTFGENLFAGSLGNVSARDVVAAWLRSPPHRANLLRTDFRHVGTALVRAPDLLGGGGDAAVWVAAFGAPR